MFYLNAETQRREVRRVFGAAFGGVWGGAPDTTTSAYSAPLRLCVKN